MSPSNRQRPLCALAAILVGCGMFLGESRITPLCANDDLSHLRSEVQSQGPFTGSAQPPTPEKSSKYQSNSFFDEDTDDEAESALASMLIVGGVVVAAAPFWGPAFLSGDNYSSAAYFPRYPYQEPLEGHLMVEPFIPRKPREWSGRVQLEHGADFNDVDTWNGGLLVETTSRFGIDSRTFFFSERQNATVRDELWIGDANLVFRFAQSTNLEMRTGIGVNWLGDQIGNDTGFNFTYGGDWFPVRPWIVSSELDWGEIGHSSLFHARVTAGVQWHRAEVYAGYDYFDVGNAQFDTLLAGLRFWF